MNTVNNVQLWIFFKFCVFLNLFIFREYEYKKGAFQIGTSQLLLVLHRETLYSQRISYGNLHIFLSFHFLVYFHQVLSVLENEWLWHDGSHLSWASWLPGQPNDWMGQDCLGLALMNMFSNVSTVFWNDLACERISHFMCEKEIFAGVCVGGGVAV